MLLDLFIIYTKINNSNSLGERNPQNPKTVHIKNKRNNCTLKVIHKTIHGEFQVFPESELIIPLQHCELNTQEK